jgi:WD40 repeat protein
VHRALANAAQDWVAADRNDDLLFRGTRLAAALDVADAHPAEINPLERDFLGASRAHQDVELRTAQRTTHRLRRLTVGLSVVVVVAVVASVFSLAQRSRANRNADRAAQQAVVAEVQRLAVEGRARAAERPDLGLLLAVQARELHPSVETDRELQAALLEMPAGVERVFDFSVRDTWRHDRSYDGRLYVVNGADDTEYRLLDVATGKLVRTLTGAQGGQGQSGLSPNGRWAIAGTGMGLINVWEAATGRRVGALDAGGSGPVYGVFDPSNPDRIYAAAYDGRVLRWDLGSADPTPIEVYRAPALPGRQPGFPPYILRLSRDGTRLGVSSPATQGPSAGPTRVVDTATGALVRTVPGVMGDFSPDGSMVVTAQSDGVRRWNLATGEQAGGPFRDANGKPRVPGPLATYSPDGRFLAVGDFDDRQVLAFDVETGNSVMEPVSSGASYPVPSFTQSGDLLVVRGARGVVIRLGQQDVPPIATVFGRPDVSAMAFTGGGRDRIVTVDALFGSNGLVTSPYEGTQVWDASTGRAVETVNPPEGGEGRFVFPSPDFRRFTDGWAEEIHVYQEGRSEPLGVIPYDPADPPGERWWSPDGRILAVGHINTVDLYRVRHGSLAPVVTLEPAGPTATLDDPGLTMVFTPDSRRLAVVRVGGSDVTLFDTQSGRRQRVTRLGHDLATRAVTISPDGRTLALAVTKPLGGDRSIVMFRDIETGRVRARAKLPVNIASLALIRHGKAFATAEGDGAGHISVVLWNARTFQQIGEAIESSGGFWGLAPTGDGNRLAVGRGRGGTIVWDVDPNLWVRRACKIAGRTLTQEEWKRFLPDRPYDPACRT